MATEPYAVLLRRVALLALPVIAANLLQSLVNVVDVFLAGRLGPLAIAAVGLSSSIRMVVIIGIFAVTAGSMALAAQARGARDPAQLSFVVRQSLSLAVLVGLGLGAVGWVAAEPLLAFLNSGGDPLAVELGAQYLTILFAGTVFLTLNFTINSLMQGAGDTVTPLYISGGVNVLNVVLSYLLTFGVGPLPALGVAGLAWGTVLARIIASAIGLAILYSGKNVIALLPGSYRPDLGMFRDILAIGIPSGLQGIVRNTAQLLVVRIVTSTAAGTYGAAALAVGFQVESLAFMPGLAIAVAATSLVGRSLGAWQVATARQHGNAAVLLGIAVMSAIAVPLFLFAPQLIRLFDPSAHPTVLSAGTSYLRINALSQPVLAVAMVLNGALRGAGDTTPGLIGTVIGRVLIVVPLAHLLALTLGFGVEGVWWALVIGTVFQAGYVLVRWQSQAWLKVALHKTRLYRLHLQHLPEDAQQRYLDEVRAPLMALPGSVEQVAEDQVSYMTPKGSVVIAFHRQGYRIREGHALLRSAPAHD